MINLILFILILGSIVLVHESGHFLFAKLTGVQVFEFSIGMGPAIFTRKGKDGTSYSLRAIPIGGYVSLAGEDPEVDLTKNKGKNLQDKTVLQRFLVMSMGVGFNFIYAFLILFFVGLIFGSATLKPVISNVTEGYPASMVGIEKGDKVLSINDRKVTFIDDITLYLTVENLKENVSIEVEKPTGKIEKYVVTPVKEKINDEDTYRVGIELSDTVEKGFSKAVIYSFKKAGAIFKQMFVVLGSLFTGKLSINKLSGPVGIYSIVGQTKSQGIASLLYLVALLSINVGVINILPFPAFDGGRVLFLIIEKLKGSPVSPKVENTIHSIGFILLILLMIYITFNDIFRLF